MGKFCHETQNRMKSIFEILARLIIGHLSQVFHSRPKFWDKPKTHFYEISRVYAFRFQDIALQNEHVFS